MGSITVRKRQDGSSAYLAQVTIKSEGRIIHREARTFDREGAAKDWMKKREKEARTPEGLATMRQPAKTLADAIDKYTHDSEKSIGRSKAQVLRSIKDDHEIAKKRCDEIVSADIVELAKTLRGQMQPQTVAVYISALSSVFLIANAAWKIPLQYREMQDAVLVCKKLGLIAKSAQRQRRPTLDELDAILTYYADQQVRKPLAFPMDKIILFAIFSTRRQEEMFSMTWSDLDEEHSRVLVRNMKNPGEKIGNDVWCDLPELALAVIETMPKVASDERIFPFNHRSVGASFTRTCAFLEIEDLHFHDLRHEGVSLLFERGLQIPQAAAVSGHRSWASLKRYTHIRGKGDKYADWKWLKLIMDSSGLEPKTQKNPDAEASG